MTHARRKGRTEGFSRRYVQNDGCASFADQHRGTHAAGGGCRPVCRLRHRPGQRPAQHQGRGDRPLSQESPGTRFQHRPRRDRRHPAGAERRTSTRAPRSGGPGGFSTCPSGRHSSARWWTPSGRPLDDQGEIRAAKRLPVEREAPPVMARDPVTVPLQTGIKVIDALIPIGRGQRELIVGDRQTGKTAIALDTIINQCGQERHLHLLRHRQEGLRRGQGHRRPQGSTRP